MPRSMSADFLEAISSQKIRPAIFVEAHFTSGPAYMWTGVGTLSWNGHDWLGVGSLGSVSTIEEGTSVEAKGITLSLSGIDATLLTGILQEFQVGLPCIVYLGMFDSSLALIDDPLISWAGRMDQPTVEMDGTTASISINCENRMVEMNVAVDRRLTNEDQQRDNPGDRGLEFVNSLQETVLYWGRSPSATNVN